MQNLTKMFTIALLAATVLAGCRGDSPFKGESAPDDGAVDPGDDGTTLSGVTYLPLSVFEASSDFSGFEEDNVFQGDSWYYVIPDAEEPVADGDDLPTFQDAFIESYVINPVDAATLERVETALASDYKATVDDIEIDPKESYPLLQKMIGVDSQLTTALVFDLSDSVTGTDIQALVNEAKAYIAAVRTHSNPLIRNQAFVVWAFGRDVVELTDGFTTNSSILNAALDSVVTLNTTRDLGSTSNLHRAVVQAIGRYVSEEDGIDFSGDGLNDLVDVVSNRGTWLSQMVLFSSGPDTYRQMDQDVMIQAIKSQSFVRYDPAAGGSTDSMLNLYKPLFYYVVGGTSAGVRYSALGDVAEKVTSLTLSSGTYEFDASLIEDQISAIDARIDLSNQYIYRFAFVPRTGDHTTVFSSKSNGNNYSLTSKYQASEEDINVGSPDEELITLLEITGVNGEYISNRDVPFSEARTFAPSTRWTATSYTSSDYAWSISGGAGVRNADGTYTVTSVSPGGARLTLTNTERDESTYIFVTD